MKMLAYLTRIAVASLMLASCDEDVSYSNITDTDTDTNTGTRTSTDTDTDTDTDTRTDTDASTDCLDIPPPPETVDCSDTPPDETYTCEQQAGWGQCDEPWMAGYCDASCGRCADDCTTLAQQGHCTQAWMQGYCEQTCFRCGIDPLPQCPDPVNPNASQSVRNVLCYFYEIFGTYVLSGQQDCSWSTPGDLEFIDEHTGKSPAVVGGDMLYDDVVSQAITQWNAGGLSMIRYHMGRPEDADSYESSLLTTDLEDTLTPGTDRYNGLMDKFDHAAHRLQTLQDAGVVVLWAPFHESQPGGWFWWSKGTADQLKALWQLMFDNFNERGLDNLIWLFPFTSTPHPDWYPGDAVVDMAGPDSYDNDAPFIRSFGATQAIVGPHMPIPLHETGSAVNPDDMFQQGAAPWVMFSIWCDTWLRENPITDIQHAYDHVQTLSRTDLPSF